MICLIETVNVPKTNAIIQLFRRRKGDRGVACRRDAMLGLLVLRLAIEINPAMSQKVLQSRLKEAVGLMQSARITHVLFSRNFPYREIILREGFDEASADGLQEQYAGSIAARFTQTPVKALLSTSSLTRSTVRTLLELYKAFRHVMLITDPANMSSVEEIGRPYGVSVIINPVDNMLQELDAAVFFSAPPRPVTLPQRCTVVAANKEALTGVFCSRLITGVRFALVNDADKHLPDGFPAEPLFAAALAAGTLQPGELVLKGAETAAQV